MTREELEKVRGALEVISEQCKATSSCDNCPLFDCCQEGWDCLKLAPIVGVSGGGLDDSN